MTTRPTPTPTPTPQRRAHPRFVLRLSAEVRSGERRFAAVTRDLSLGGCSVEAPYPLPEGESIALALFVVVDDIEEATLPPLECRADVQWTAANDEAPLESRHIAGLRFVELGAAQRAWLARFLPDET
jgi:c-di-GMP-binding flagellar brake protein YcgR